MHAIQGVQKEEMTGSPNKNVSEHGCEMLMEAVVQMLNKPRRTTTVVCYVEIEMLLAFVRDYFFYNNFGPAQPAQLSKVETFDSI